jgi:hypothetical protein
MGQTAYGRGRSRGGELHLKHPEFKYSAACGADTVQSISIHYASAITCKSCLKIIARKAIEAEAARAAR